MECIITLAPKIASTWAHLNMLYLVYNTMMLYINIYLFEDHKNYKEVGMRYIPVYDINEENLVCIYMYV